MKKKIFQKILAVGSVCIAVTFVIVLLVTIFGGITPEQFDNSLVKGLFITLGVLYFVISAGTLTYTFLDSDTVKEIIINSEKASSTKATASVISKLTKKAVNEVEGVKCQKVAISMNEYGTRLKVSIKIKDRDVHEVTAILRGKLENVFNEVFGYRFSNIDFKAVSLTSSYQPNMTEIENSAKEEVEIRHQKLSAEQALANAEIQEKMKKETADAESKVKEYNESKSTTTENQEETILTPEETIVKFDEEDIDPEFSQEAVEAVEESEEIKKEIEELSDETEIAEKIEK